MATTVTSGSTTPSYASSTELDAVNSILMSIGESPVNTLSTKSPEVAIAQTTLRQVSREVQSEGWVFNTEYEVEFCPDQNDQIKLNDSILQVDINKYRHHDGYDVVRKTGFLYDRYEKSNKFTDLDKLYCDVVWMFDFADCPQPFKDYITARSARIAATRMVNDPESTKLLQDDELIARSTAIEYDTRQADYNVFTSNRLRQPYTSYTPFKVLNR